jgi:hypothetical protein
MACSAADLQPCNSAKVGKNSYSCNVQHRKKGMWTEIMIIWTNERDEVDKGAMIGLDKKQQRTQEKNAIYIYIYIYIYSSTD